MTPTNNSTEGNCRDPDLVGAEAAICRAARRARESAARVGLGTMVSINGRVVEEYSEATITNSVKISGDRHEP